MTLGLSRKPDLARPVYHARVKPYHVRRRDKAITDPDAVSGVLNEARYVTVAMCADDQPYLVALNHGWDPEARCLYVHCAPGGKKLEILEANPRVWGMAVVDLGYLDGRCDHAYRSVMFGGRVTLLTDPGKKRAALENMIRRLESDPEAVMSEQLTPARIRATTIGRIDVDELTGKESPG